MISLVLGLGNIGEEYRDTRHNVGFAVLDRVTDRLEAKVLSDEATFRSALASLASQAEDGRKVLMAWPSTFMNRSGEAAVWLLERDQLSPGEMLVVVDDYNLPLGSLRFRSGGSDGGHNGLASIIDCLGRDDFPRLRLGIGAPSDMDRVTEYVLGHFDDAEEPEVKKMLDWATEAVIFALDHRLEEAMSRYNINPALPDNA